MSNDQDQAQAGSQKMETNIIFESPKKTVAQHVVIWVLRTFALFAGLAGVAYIFFNFTPAGEEIKEKYEKRSRETDKMLDDGIETVRFLISLNGRAPASAQEVRDFQVNRLMHPFCQYKLADGRNLPYWNGKDGFGHDVDIHVDPHTRRIKLVSRGLLPISGSYPVLFDYDREASY